MIYMKDKAIIERILNAIAIRPELIKQFADILKMSEQEFKEWVELAQVPEVPELPKNLQMVYRPLTDEDGYVADSFFAICATEDKAQAKIDHLTEDFGSMGFAYRPVVLE